MDNLSDFNDDWDVSARGAQLEETYGEPQEEQDHPSLRGPPQNEDTFRNFQ